MASHGAGSLAAASSGYVAPAVIDHGGGGVGTSSEAATETVRLNTCDGKSTEVTKLLLKNLGNAEQRLSDDPNTAFDFFAEQLREAICYCEKHMESGVGEEEIQEFNRGLMSGQRTENLVRLLRCARALDMEDLMDLVQQTLAKRIENKSVEYVRKLFSIQEDFTEDEEAAIRAEHPWAYEGVDPDDD